jgi:hypothetical protein
MPGASWLTWRSRVFTVSAWTAEATASIAKTASRRTVMKARRTVMFSCSDRNDPRCDGAMAALQGGARAAERGLTATWLRQSSSTMTRSLQGTPS